MLLMSAAFMPAISDYVDVGKLPPPETVTKHLSPIVSSQRYEGDGYVTEWPNTLEELKSAMQKGNTAFASPGAGTTPHLTAENLFHLRWKTDATHVPFKGNADVSIMLVRIGLTLGFSR